MTGAEHGAGSRRTREELLADIERTRENLSATSSELASKFDVRSPSGSAAQSAGTALLRSVDRVTRAIDRSSLQRYGPAAATIGVLVVVIALRWAGPSRGRLSTRGRRVGAVTGTANRNR